MKALNLRMLLISFAAMALSVSSSTSLAADVGGTVKGTVTSPSGERVESASITITNTAKGTTRTTQANSDGEFILRNVPVGDSTLRVSAAGYSISESNVLVTVGSAVVVETTLQDGSLEEVVVLGTVVKKLDMAETTGGMSFDDNYIDLMPVENGFESMVLMTPGTVDNASTQFNGANAIGGASSAENAYYLNGINITDIETGMGSFGLPWEVVQQTNVQTSGVTAEFGGALGGIVNAVSKSGSNEFEFGVSYRTDPESLDENPRSVFENDFNVNPGAGEQYDAASYWVNNQRDSDSFTEMNLWASGPIVQDKAFFYVLLNPRKTNTTFASNTTFSDRETTADRYFIKLDWSLTENHSVGLTIFNTESEESTKLTHYDAISNSLLRETSPGVYVSDESAPTEIATSYFDSGQEFTGLTYEGSITDRLSVSAVVGITKQNDTPTPGSSAPFVCAAIGLADCITISSHTDSRITFKEFERTQYRIDFNFDAADHQIAFGVDAYETDVFINERQNGVPVAGDDEIGLSGGVSPEASVGWWRLGTATPGLDFAAEALEHGVPADMDFVGRRIRTRYTDSKVSSTALYISDSWQVSDIFTFNYGFRYTDFENNITTGEAYADLSGNVAPRLGAVWNIGGEGRRKFYATLGRYYQPVASRMNFTQGSQSVEYFDYYAWPGNVDAGGDPLLLADGSPERGAPITEINNAPNNPENRIFRQVGITDPGLIASKNLKAMYSDQITFGYSSEISDTLTGEVRFTYNELKRSVEDTDYNPVIQRVLAAQGIADNTGQSSYYILANPGSSVELDYDFDGDGTRDQITLTPEDLQLAEATRKYLAWDFILSGQVNDRLSFHSAYTWSNNYGNTEGLVKTTNEQADPGWTSDYDSGEYLDYATGRLPNDRRHSIKVSGLYDLTDSITLGLVYRGASGQPLNSFYVHPNGIDSCALGSPWEGCPGGGRENFYDANGNPAPRGSAGNLPWQSTFDLSLTYTNLEILGGLTLKATVYNFFNAQSPTRVNQTMGANYGLPNNFQTPRYASLIARLEF